MQLSDVWYLGIDVGTTGISAILLNAGADEQYPIYWTTVNNQGELDSSFRLPSAAYSGMVAGSDRSQASASTVGSMAFNLTDAQSGVLIQKFKPYLKIAVPYYSPQTHNWEPILQWSDEELFSLYWLQRALQGLLSTLKPSNEVKVSSVKVGAMGLKDEGFKAAMRQLGGVILGNPVDWSDTYRFNLREVILGTQLVKRPEQVFFIEDAIATLLSRIDEIQQANFTSVLPGDSPFTGSILAINAGATTTELGLVDLSANLQNLTHSDFIIRSFPYGGNAIDQDIVCQMFLLNEGTSIDDEIFQASGLNIDSLAELPLPGSTNLEIRSHFQQLLQSCPFGQALLEAATYLKLVLQYQEEFTLNLGDQKWVCTRTDLQTKIILPFIQQLNREVNSLLIQTEKGLQGVSQVVCTGGTSAFKEIGDWVQQKFLNATLVKDKYKDGGLKSCSRVAHGLATLPLYPKILERQNQQYSDYFLLLELLNNFPETTTTLGEIMQALERRGINTRTCKQRIINILEGQLPPGLVPAIADSYFLSLQSKQNLEYEAIVAAPLFYKEEHQLYRPNLEQYQHLCRYLSLILAGTYQKFDEPLLLTFI